MIRAKARPLPAIAAVLVLVLAAAGIAVLGANDAATPSGATRTTTEAPAAPGDKPAPAPAPANPGARPMRSAPDAGLLAVHAHGKAQDLPSPLPMEPVPEAVLLVSGHATGWITPCGCPGSQAGGVARRAGYAGLLRKTFPGLPVHYVDLGGFLGLGGPVQEATTVALIESMQRIGYEAVNAAAEDLGVTREQAEFLDRTLKVPRFSSNIVFHDNGRLAFPPYHVITVPARGPGHESDPGIRIGLMGLIDDRIPLFAFGAGGRSLVASSASAALDRYLPELKAKSDLIVLLAEMDPGRLDALLQNRKGIDFVVGGRGVDFITEPRDIRGVPVVAVGNQGKYLAELRITRKDGKPAIVPFVHWLDERYPEEPELARYAEGTLDEVNEVSRKETAKATTPPPDIAPFVTADRCQSCHEEAYKTWKGSKHAHAIETLVRLKRDYTVACVTCHVSGYGADAGGFVNPHATAQLVNVQCEVCHGPGQAHVGDPSAPYGKVDHIVCKGCHSPATDPTFDFDTRWKTIAH